MQKKDALQLEAIKKKSAVGFSAPFLCKQAATPRSGRLSY